MEKNWDENFVFENFNFFKIFGKKKINFDENEPTGFVFHEGKKKNSKKGSGCGVTPLEKLGKEKKNLPEGVRGSNGPPKEKNNLKRGFGVQENRQNPREGNNSKGGTPDRE